MASFQILSDLHLESPSAYDVFEVHPHAPYLALLGDIGNVKDKGLFLFLETQLRQFQIVFFLLGNHEPYHSDWKSAGERIAAFSKSINLKRAHEAEKQHQQQQQNALGKFVFLDETRYDVCPEVTVLGCTLYSRIRHDQFTQVSFGLNDFFHINGWTVGEHSACHEVDRKWLNAQVSQIAASEPHRSIVIFTHHSPSLIEAAVDPQHVNSPISSGFVSDMSGEPCWENPRVKLWAFGHTHYNCDFTEERTGKRVVANQRGYYFAQAQVFKPDLVVEV